MASNQVHFNFKRDRGITGKIIYKLYSIKKPTVRKFLFKVMWRRLGSQYQFYSETLRKIFRDYHGVDIGLYTHGGCFVPDAMPRGTKVGRYCSIAMGMTVHNANHPMNLKSSHAFFFNPSLGYSSEDIIPRNALEIGNDVWVGQNSIILAGCSKIGDGAVIGAGAIVNKDIPPYAIALGNPCRVIQYRFSNEKIEEIKAEKWWDRTIEELTEELNLFQTPLEGDEIK